MKRLTLLITFSICFLAIPALTANMERNLVPGRNNKKQKK